LIHQHGYSRRVPDLAVITCESPAASERKSWNQLLEPLRKAEKSYQAERDEYLRKVEKEAT
jgi:hypothetical protein